MNNMKTIAKKDDATALGTATSGSTLKRRGSLRAIRPIFASYDFWVGVFWDRKKLRLYVLPLPCIGVVFYFNARPCHLDKHEWEDNYYGHQCKRCDTFYPFGHAPWNDMDEPPF